MRSFLDSCPTEEIISIDTTRCQIEYSDPSASTRKRLTSIHAVFMRIVARFDFRRDLEKSCCQCLRILWGHAVPRSAAPRHCIFGQVSPPPPSGKTHTMFCAGSLMSQLLQCTQFCTLMTSRSLPPSFFTNSYAAEPEAPLS